MAKQKTIPKTGTYKARRNGDIVIYETDAGALCVAIPYLLLNADIAFGGKHTMTIGKFDGTIQTKTLKTLHDVFPAWETDNPFDLQSLPQVAEGEAEFELADCYHDDSYTPPDWNVEKDGPYLTFKPQWFNRLGGSSNMPDKATETEQASLLSKWGSKFNVTAPKTAAKPAPVETPAVEPVAKKAPGRKPAVAKVAAKTWTSSEEVYSALLKKHGADTDAKKEETVAQDVWYPACDAVCGENVPPTTAEHFTAIAEKLGL